jgi:hypothetical protein
MDPVHVQEALLALPRVLVHVAVPVVVHLSLRLPVCFERHACDQWGKCDVIRKLTK